MAVGVVFSVLMFQAVRNEHKYETTSVGKSTMLETFLHVVYVGGKKAFGKVEEGLARYVICHL